MTGFNSKRDAAADKQKEYDPCPQCIKGAVCRTPKCGRLALPLDHPFRNAQPTQKLVECLDCGSNNVGLPATYDSLVNSVKAQPVQEPVAWMWKDMRGQDIVSLFEPRLDSTPLYTVLPKRTEPAQEPRDIAALVEGMEVSIDVSTGEHDSGNRLFGTVTLAQENQSSKHGLILLVQEPEPNFKTTAPPQSEWNNALDEAASRIGEIKGFGKATQDSFAIYIRGLKR